MSIRTINPPDWRDASIVQGDSDAPDNVRALREIEHWAEENGFVRTTEYWLRQAIIDEGKRVFRGVCFRVSAEEKRAAEEINRRVMERMSRMPVTLR